MGLFSKARMARLIAIVAAAQDFDMGRWSSCALGKAADDLEFQRYGLKRGSLDVPQYVVADTFYTGDDAAQRFFGITHEEARYLFMSPEAVRRSKEEQIAAIREVMARYEPGPEVQRREQRPISSGIVTVEFLPGYTPPPPIEPELGY